jgi:hypothetical protein
MAWRHIIMKDDITTCQRPVDEQKAKEREKRKEEQKEKIDREKKRKKT